MQILTLSVQELEKFTRQTEEKCKLPRANFKLVAPESAAFRKMVEDYAAAALAEDTPEAFARHIEELSRRALEVGFRIGRNRGIF